MCFASSREIDFNVPVNIILLLLKKFLELETIFSFITKILDIKNNIVSKSKNFFNNKSIVFTGTLNSISRDEAKHMAKKVGAKILSSVTKNTDYVIIGDKAGSKEKKARELKINIFSEKDFLNKIKS